MSDGTGTIEAEVTHPAMEQLFEEKIDNNATKIELKNMLIAKGNISQQNIYDFHGKISLTKSGTDWRIISFHK